MLCPSQQELGVRVGCSASKHSIYLCSRQKRCVAYKMQRVRARKGLFMRLTTALSSRRFPALSIGLAAVLSALAAGCAELPEAQTATGPEELLSDNGLKTINGMKVHNGLGLASIGNGLNLASSLK